MHFACFDVVPAHFFAYVMTKLSLELFDIGWKIIKASNA